MEKPLKLEQAITNLGEAAAKTIAAEQAAVLGISWDNAIATVFGAIANDPARVPGNIGGSSDDENSAIAKWLLRYHRGKEHRASKRLSKPPGTIADPIIEEIIGARLSTLTAGDLKKINYAHRLGMSAENILGLILEEYLADNLESHGWCCAWGETVKSVDFVHVDGRLLQVKNRSNSENSSSSAIRQGTEILKWHRIDANDGSFFWASLNEICGINSLSEASFIRFVRSTIKKNPDCLAIERKNTWDADNQ